MNLDTIVFNDITVGRMLFWVAVVVAIYMVPKLYKLIFGKKKVVLQHTVYFVCSNCGWEGHISKFGTRCPKCDAAAGDLGAGPG
jgi:Zn finger protein HypA/HybF involved in hydrogenase expression